MCLAHCQNILKSIPRQKTVYEMASLLLGYDRVEWFTFLVYFGEETGELCYKQCSSYGNTFFFFDFCVQKGSLLQILLRKAESRLIQIQNGLNMAGHPILQMLVSENSPITLKYWKVRPRELHAVNNNILNISTL